MKGEYVKPDATDTPAFPDDWSTTGASMLPFVPPRSRLTLRRLGDPRNLRAGDIVCYIGTGSAFVAHRVVGMQSSEQGLVLEVAGDASGESELVAATAVLGVVSRISFGPVSYSADGIVGNSAAWLALRAPRLLVGGARLVSLGLRLTRPLGKLIRP